ncbi:hypothetical protein HTSR_1276 [Halodesulfurarchaeum formicicum]|uniref:Uncharacterized protein n=1 Tax=Halodesulfurarchaeum formicicum TaxID=1873524 RepID=A0A1D8S523_9EURY|nr:hypothetical protein [Halodesulfurarchaeum formicicum]AOW80453.1 hypothetical protein HTSR_1276 [Halodesulfurarchaeum formicicum]APE95792.1 hypothetical protein HSR6_1349 [Halodesulfurarchaeum formicicum]
MDEPQIDRPATRDLGRAIAAKSHDDLAEDTVDAVLTLTDGVKKALESGAPPTAADGLLAFWAGHVGAKLGIEEAELDETPTAEHFDRAFQADALGVDLYQALSKVAAARTEDADFDLEGWTQRLLELTNRHVAHLESHQESG